MATRRLLLGGLLLGLGLGLAWDGLIRPAAAQGPTIPSLHGGQPGTTVSSLGPSPGAGVVPFGFMPGAGEMILGGGRPGPSFPRVPSSISTPGQGVAAATLRKGITVPGLLPTAKLAIYGTLALPAGTEEEGPPDGLTLDQALDRLVLDNLDLRSKSFEIPQGRADILTASLRANPIFYADGQLIPYGKYSKSLPGGPTQYDVNISYPFDLSHKRQARTVVAGRVLSVLEAQYLNAVRVQISNLYTAYVDVLATRETVRFAEASRTGLDRVLEMTETLYKRADVSRPDVVRIRMQKESAEVGVREARVLLLQTKRSLATLLSMPPEQAETLELRGTIGLKGPPLAAPQQLVELALEVRPDLIAHRLDIQRAEADIQLARADRFADVYLLYQPYTLQNNTPFGLKSPTSWALGVTVPIPIFNRNQGLIQRAYLNVTQVQVSTSALEQQVSAEVIQAQREFALSREVVERFEAEVLPNARQMLDDALVLFTRGEHDALTYYNTRRNYNETIRRYRDALVRYRRSMLALNTAVGQRILP
jgi:cobalt-zinc-cadmium efflux system outer membrane protein